MIVRIPFLREFRDAMLDGRKTWTSRTKRYGDVGDCFEAFNADFEIIQVFKIPLGVVAHHHFKEEGFATADDIIECWKKIHPRKGYVPTQKVWVHVFKKMEIE